MKIKKVWEIARSMGECFTMGAGVVSLVCGIVAAFTGIGLIIPLAAAVGVGVVAAGLGAYYTYRKLQAKEGREREELAERNSFHATEAKIASFAKDLDSEIKDIKRDIAEHHTRSLRSFRKPHRYNGVMFSKSYLRNPKPANDATYNLAKRPSVAEVIATLQMK